MTDIETNVAAKSVVVTHADGVSPSEMLDKLTKVRSCVFLVDLYDLVSIRFIRIKLIITIYHHLLLLQPSGLKQSANWWHWPDRRFSLRGSAYLLVQSGVCVCVFLSSGYF